MDTDFEAGSKLRHFIRSDCQLLILSPPPALGFLFHCLHDPTFSGDEMVLHELHWDSLGSTESDWDRLRLHGFSRFRAFIHFQSNYPVSSLVTLISAVCCRLVGVNPDPNNRSCRPYKAPAIQPGQRLPFCNPLAAETIRSAASDPSQNFQ